MLTLMWALILTSAFLLILVDLAIYIVAIM